MNVTRRSSNVPQLLTEWKALGPVFMGAHKNIENCRIKEGVVGNREQTKIAPPKN